MSKAQNLSEIAEPAAARAEEVEVWLIEALSSYGPSVMFVVALASCLALPVPASLAMISAAAIAAGGDMALWQIALACFAGAVAGDGIAYLIGRAGRGPLVRWIDARPSRAEARRKSERWMKRHGGPGILFSRWPISPIGPYINYAAGAGGYPWARFLAWSAPGEALWVTVNLTLGYVFAGQIAGAAMILHEATGLILSLLALVAILWGIRRIAHPSAMPPPPRDPGAAPAPRPND